MLLYLNRKGAKIMLEIKINERDYYVFREKEFNIIGNLNTPFLSHPNYYDLNITETSLQYTNNKNVIIPADLLKFNKITNQISASFGLPITLEEYETLYELYLDQMNENPTEEFITLKEIKQDIEHAKTLVKKNKRA